MEEAGFLYQVISEFCTDKGDFSPEKISAVDMGYILPLKLCSTVLFQQSQALHRTTALSHTSVPYLRSTVPSLSSSK